MVFFKNGINDVIDFLEFLNDDTNTPETIFYNNPLFKQILFLLFTKKNQIKEKTLFLGKVDDDIIQKQTQ